MFPIILNFHKLVDKQPEIPVENNPYQVSKLLLCRTIYGSLITCQARFSMGNMLEFHAGFHDRPYSYKEIDLWCYADALLFLKD